MTIDQIVDKLNANKPWWVRQFLVEYKDGEKRIVMDFPWFAMPMYWVLWIKSMRRARRRNEHHRE